MAKKRIPAAQFVSRDSIPDLIEDLLAKKIDAAILEKPVAESFVFRNKTLMNIECQAGSRDTLLGSAIAVKKGNQGFLEEINRILRKLRRENKIMEFVEDAKILMHK
jgi:polar amino acid transport system substrate-binding protein